MRSRRKGWGWGLVLERREHQAACGAPAISWMGQLASSGDGSARHVADPLESHRDHQ